MARPTLGYRRPQLGRDYWILDDALANAPDVARRCYATPEWELGAPHRPLPWPGRRAPHALLPEELAPLEAWVRQATGARRLWQAATPDGHQLSHNHIQLVGLDESGPRPHTDSRLLCRYAAVLYLTPAPEPDCGTAFYRLRYRDGSLGGNLCGPAHRNLREALGVTALPPDAWAEELRIENRFNRLLVYRGDLVHSASGYFGFAHADKRMTAVFFWMA